MLRWLTITSILCAVPRANGQVIGTHSKLEIGAGYVFSHHDGFGILRATFAVNDFLANQKKYGLGAYITPEYRGRQLFGEDGLPYYFRIPMGVTFKLAPSVGFFGGVDLYHWAKGRNPRSEIGVMWTMSDQLIVRMGYSQWVGATIEVGYQWELVRTPFRDYATK